MRIGFGYDVHKLIEGRKLILGGVEVPFEKGLLGHSDADVLIHAVMDALLGAAGIGDIGLHFPDRDSQYKNISSLVLLTKVTAMLEERGFACNNLDCTIVAQAPKLASYREEMCDNLARIMGIDPGCVNVKATTTEGLGFAGQGEGIAAYAVCTIKDININKFI